MTKPRNRLALRLSHKVLTTVSGKAVFGIDNGAEVDIIASRKG